LIYSDDKCVYYYTDSRNTNSVTKAIQQGQDLNNRRLHINLSNSTHNSIFDSFKCTLIKMSSN